MSNDKSNDMEGIDPKWWPPKSMFLDTIQNASYLVPPLLRETNITSDIAGAQPTKFIGKYQKPNFHSPEDIRGAKPNPLYHFLRNRPNLHDPTDIVKDKTSFKAVPYTFKTNRVVNPLTPVYPLPSFKTISPRAPRFIRDNLEWRDVTMSTKRRMITNSKLQPDQDQNYIFDNYKGFRKQLHSDKLSDKFNVDDILRKKWRTCRRINPLEPVYKMNSMSFGHIQRNRPFPVSKKYIRSSNLSTNDIPGAQADTKHRRIRAALTSTENQQDNQT